MDLPKLTLTIEKLTSEGSGLARHEGKVIFVPSAVPGDTVEAEIEKEGKDYNEARLLVIQEKSPDRVEPSCPYFYKCGGCQMQHLNYEAQLKWKKEMVLDALKRIACLQDPPVSEVLPSPKPLNYRSRIQLQKDRNGRVGFYKAKSHEIVEIESCLIADERLNEKIGELRGELQSVDKETKGESADETKQEESKSEVGSPKSEVGSQKTKTSDEKSSKLLADKRETKDKEWPLELRLDDSTSFTQINPEQNKKLIDVVLEFAAIQRMDQVFDLFCGNGNITFPLSEKAGHVWGIEKSKKAISEGENQSKEKNITNITWKQGAVKRVLSQLKNKGFHCRVLAADPPRRGMAEEIEEILKFSPERIVYVSCNPATFARDARQLVKSNYSLQKCQPIDMFPQTAHVEVASLFTRE